jgi:hypothetical protein
MIRSRLITPWTVITCAIVVVYVAAWFVVSHILRSGIEDWVTDRRNDGWTVEHGTIAMSGFPYSWQATIDAPRLANARQKLSYRWSGPAIALNWQPWNPHTVNYTTSGTHKIHVGPGSHAAFPETDLKMARGEGQVMFGPQGRLSRLEILLDDGILVQPDLPSLRFNRFLASIDNNPPPNGVKPAQPHLIPSFRLDSEIFGLTLPEGQRLPLGRTFGHIALEGIIMGNIPSGRPAEALLVWQQDGGTVEINRLDVGWGPLKVRTSGTMALDSALQPVAALTGIITGYNKTLEVLATAKLIEPGIAHMGKFALGSMARPSTTGGQPEIEVPVTLQKRWLYVGPIKLLQLPTIRWH